MINIYIHTDDDMTTTMLMKQKIMVVSSTYTINNNGSRLKKHIISRLLDFNYTHQVHIHWQYTNIWSNLLVLWKMKMEFVVFVTVLSPNIVQKLLPRVSREYTCTLYDYFIFYAMLCREKPKGWHPELQQNLSLSPPSQCDDMKRAPSHWEQKAERVINFAEVLGCHPLDFCSIA